MIAKANKALSFGMSLALLVDGGPKGCDSPTSKAERLARELRCDEIAHTIVEDAVNGGKDLVFTPVMSGPKGAEISVEGVSGTIYHPLIRGGGSKDFEDAGNSHTVDHNGSTSSVSMFASGTVTAQEDGTTARFNKECPMWLDIELLSQGAGGSGEGDGESGIRIALPEFRPTHVFSLGALATAS